MTRTEHLLTILAEECAEVAQRVSKAIRFGLTEVQPGQPLTNAKRIEHEMLDLLAAWNMLAREGAFPDACGPNEAAVRMEAKAEKVERFLAFSAGRGLVDGIPANPDTLHPEAEGR